MCLRLYALALSALGIIAQTIPQTTPEALVKRGQYYSELAMHSRSELMQTAPESAYALALLGGMKSKEHQYTAALNAYNEAAARMPGLRGVHSAIADIYVVLGKPAEASAAEAAEQKLGSPDCTVEKLQCDFSAGRFDDVLNAAKQKAGPEGLYWLARASQELAIHAFAELDNLPESVELHEAKAQILRELGKYRASVDEWRAALKLSPGNRKLQHELAISLFLTQDYQAILSELQQFLKTEPQSANLNFFVGDSLLETERIEEAAPYLETALKLDPKLLPAHVALGLCYVRLGQMRKAIPHLKKGLSMDKDGSLYYQLARAYQASGQPELAKEMMDRYQAFQKSAAQVEPR